VLANDHPVGTWSEAAAPRRLTPEQPCPECDRQ